MKDNRTSPVAGFITQNGAVVAAVVAGLVAVPCLGLPFLSDDWANLAAVENGFAGKTPFNYFRPLYLASYWVEMQVWGLSPSFPHLTNLLLASLTAALVVILTRRYTHDPRLAALAGILFAIHPYHIENVAWIAGRSDAMCAVFVLLGALLYDRWRETSRGVPIAALLSFEAALLSKESAIVLPAFLVLLGILDRGRRADRGEWARGLIPMVAMGLVHFFWMRPPALTGPGIDPWSATGFAGVRRLGLYLTATLLPAQAEIIEQHPGPWFAAALVAGLAIAAMARRSASRIPTAAWVASAAFFVLLAPAVAVSFQQRYFLLPSAASAVALAALLLCIPTRAAVALGTALVAGWLVALGAQWTGWLEAGRVSNTLISSLVEASRAPHIREIVVANAPNRIHGQPVAGDWSSAVRLSGGRSVTVTTAPSVDYPSAGDTILAGPRDRAVSSSPQFVEITSVIPRRRYCRVITRQFPAGSNRLERVYGTIELDPDGTMRVRIVTAADGSRAAFLWTEGRLERLF